METAEPRGPAQVWMTGLTTRTLHVAPGNPRQEVNDGL